MLIMPILMVYFGWETNDTQERLLSLGFLAICILFVGGITASLLSGRIHISEEGVAHTTFRKRNFMPWEEIKIIGIGRTARPGGPELLYFSASIGIPVPVIIPELLNEKFFTIYHRKKIITAIRTYWKGPIAGIDFISDYP